MLLALGVFPAHQGVVTSKGLARGEDVGPLDASAESGPRRLDCHRRADELHRLLNWHRRTVRARHLDFGASLRRFHQLRESICRLHLYGQSVILYANVELGLQLWPSVDRDVVNWPDHWFHWDVVSFGNARLWSNVSRIIDHLHVWLALLI